MDNSLVGLNAHLLPPLPPQLHAAVKVIVHDAKKIIFTFSLKDTFTISWVMNLGQSDCQKNHSSIDLFCNHDNHCFTRRKTCLKVDAYGNSFVYWNSTTIR